VRAPLRAVATACLGAPPPPPPRGGGKRSRRGDVAGDDNAAAAACSLIAFGVAATLHAAPHGGALEELLQPWSGDCCVTIDRYDVRHLLPEWEPPPASRRACACAEEEVDAAALEAERFGDLWAEEEAAKTQGMRARGAAAGCSTRVRGRQAHRNEEVRDWRLSCACMLRRALLCRRRRRPRRRARGARAC
jgi:hypothetical protein